MASGERGSFASFAAGTPKAGSPRPRAMSIKSATTADAVGLYEEADPVTLAQSLFDLTEAAAMDDERRAWTIAEVDAARGTLISDVATWPGTVREQMGL